MQEQQGAEEDPAGHISDEAAQGIASLEDDDYGLNRMLYDYADLVGGDGGAGAGGGAQGAEDLAAAEAARQRLRDADTYAGQHDYLADDYYERYMSHYAGAPHASSCLAACLCQLAHRVCASPDLL